MILMTVHGDMSVQNLSVYRTNTLHLYDLYTLQVLSSTVTLIRSAPDKEPQRGA